MTRLLRACFLGNGILCDTALAHFFRDGKMHRMGLTLLRLQWEKNGDEN